MLCTVTPYRGFKSLRHRFKETRGFPMYWEAAGFFVRAAMFVERPFLDRFSQFFGIKVAFRGSSVGKVHVSSCRADVSTPVFPGYTSRYVPREHRCTFGLLTGICLYLRSIYRNLGVPRACFSAKSTNVPYRRCWDTDLFYNPQVTAGDIG